MLRSQNITFAILVYKLKFPITSKDFTSKLRNNKPTYSKHEIIASICLNGHRRDQLLLNYCRPSDLLRCPRLQLKYAATYTVYIDHIKLEINFMKTKQNNYFIQNKGQLLLC